MIDTNYGILGKHDGPNEEPEEPTVGGGGQGGDPGNE